MGKKIIRGLGYRPSEADGRDRLHAVRALALPEPPASASIADHVLDVLDQGPLGTCVLNALYQGIRTRARVKGEEGRTATEIGSRLHGYWHSSNQHGDAKNDNGTMIRTAIKVTNKIGRPFESEWPYVTKDHDDPDPSRRTFAKKPPPIVTMNAIDFRRQAFHRIAEVAGDRWDEIRRSIAAGLPVVFGTDLGESFRRYDGSGVLDIPNDNLIGGHAMLLVGYQSDDTAIGVNSWGTRWGKKGFFRISRGYLEWWRTRDLWALDLP